MFRRFAKSSLRVRPPAESAEPDPRGPLPIDRRVGLELEIVLERPTLASGDNRIAAQVLLRGEPLEGALVRSLSREGLAGEARTGDDGRVTLRLDGDGPWLLDTVHMERAPARTNADWQSLWASHVLGPPAGAGEQP